MSLWIVKQETPSTLNAALVMHPLDWHGTPLVERAPQGARVHAEVEAIARERLPFDPAYPVEASPIAPIRPGEARHLINLAFD